MAELALDDVQRHAFAGHLNCMSMTELVRCEASPYTGASGEAAQLRSCGCG